jgi:hypothetical protein
MFATLEDPVLVTEGHEIGYRAAGHELEPREAVLAEPLGLLEGEGHKEVLEEANILEGACLVPSHARELHEPSEARVLGLGDYRWKELEPRTVLAASS